MRVFLTSVVAPTISGLYSFNPEYDPHDPDAASSVEWSQFFPQGQLFSHITDEFGSLWSTGLQLISVTPIVGAEVRIGDENSFYDIEVKPTLGFNGTAKFAYTIIADDGNGNFETASGEVHFNLQWVKNWRWRVDDLGDDTYDEGDVVHVTGSGPPNGKGSIQLFAKPPSGSPPGSDPVSVSNAFEVECDATGRWEVDVTIPNVVGADCYCYFYFTREGNAQYADDRRTSTFQLIDSQ